VIRGRADDIDEQGALLVRVGERIERVIAGEIRWL
jgi:biotin-(acetyl-CoA carboxylase) ligase